MNHQERNNFIENEFNKIMRICKTKGIEYSNSTQDANENFKKLGRELGMDMKQILWVYAQKHNQAISNFLKEGKVHSEPIEGRIHDAILYHFILLSLLKEGETACTQTCVEKTERGFLAGDRVRVFQNIDNNGVGIGTEFVINRVENDLAYEDESCWGGWSLHNLEIIERAK
jgi:hypothetical protein